MPCLSCRRCALDPYPPNDSRFLCHASLPCMMRYDGFVQVAGVLPAGSLVTALLIDDLSDMPVPDDVPLLMPKV